MFMFQFCWTWPITSLWTMLSGSDPNYVTKEVLREKLKLVLSVYKGLKALDGSYVSKKQWLVPSSESKRTTPWPHPFHLA